MSLRITVLVVVHVLTSHVSVPAQTTTAAASKPAKASGGWPAGVAKVVIPCSDGAAQQAMWYAPSSPEKKPLLVGLHTWSSTYASAGGDAEYARWCIEQGWAFVHPDFRGPNWTPEALGSDRAVQDIVEAVAWARQQTEVDESRIYLIGVSGGGHMAMLMAGRHPEIWAGVSAWCGIFDIAQWHAEHQKNGASDKYAQNIEAALGHVPALEDAEARKRSPAAWLAAASVVPLDIAHGIHDGRSGSVPFRHALYAFNAVVAPAERLGEEEIQAFYQTRKLPASWSPSQADESLGSHVPHFRKVSGSTRVTIFEGGHEIVHQAALNWLALQKKGQPVIWDVKKSIPFDSAASASGK
ncbi:MAG: prolyl oligopeptidase family serine peptidase [Prosthecobacter sp.]